VKKEKRGQDEGEEKEGVTRRRENEKNGESIEKLTSGGRSRNIFSLQPGAVPKSPTKRGES